MPSAKRNSTMQRATGLNSSLLDVASSRDGPFCQPQQQLHGMHHGATFVTSLSSLFPHYSIGVDSQWVCQRSSDSADALFMVMQR